MRTALLFTSVAALFACGASLWVGGTARDNLPPSDDADDPLSLTWTRPRALAAGLAALLPSNRGIILAVDVDDRIEQAEPGLVADPLRDEFRWRLVSGEGRLTPRGDGSRCRLLPRPTADAPIVVTVRLTRTYDEPRRWGRSTEHQRTASLTGRIIAPVSGEHLDAWGRLEGFEIGNYPNPWDEAFLAGLGGDYGWVRLHAERFEPPRWFYPVTRASVNWRISEHLRLGDFTLDRPYFSLGMPQWLALDPHLISKLEDLAQAMHAAGHQFDEWTLIYGFRPPAYNLDRLERDGEDTLKSHFSQHMFGRAADILIDNDGDGILDDLNDDGRIDVHDAAVIMHFANVLDRRLRADGDPRTGGAGLYDRHDFFERAEAVGQSPYVHIDVRGFVREDGTLFRWPGRWPDTGEPIRWGEL